MTTLLALLLSTITFAADWQCGMYKTNHLQLDSDTYFHYQLIPVNEAADDTLAGAKEGRLCVKGRKILGTTRADLLVYGVKSE